MDKNQDQDDFDEPLPDIPAKFTCKKSSWEQSLVNVSNWPNFLVSVCLAIFIGLCLQIQTM